MGGASLEVVAPVDVVTTDALDVRGGRVHDQTLPVIVHEQEARVGLAVVLDPEFDERAVGDRHVVQQVLEDAILAPLGEHRELALTQAFAGRIASRRVR